MYIYGAYCRGTTYGVMRRHEGGDGPAKFTALIMAAPELRFRPFRRFEHGAQVCSATNVTIDIHVNDLSCIQHEARLLLGVYE